MSKYSQKTMPKSTANNAIAGINNMQEIIQLAKLLRDKGDKVLNANSKLSLSTSLLNNLNGAFALIVNETDDLECSFQVCNSSKNEIFRDIKFLHDFVQKTEGLKITYSINDSKTCDISKFRHLKFLEMHKISITDVKGIQGIRGQLECIIFTGGSCVNNINQLLECCGSDAGAGFIWGSLNRLALPYNNITELDKSLEYAPWLQTLDLSHNHIKRASELMYLPNLKNVNLGFNDLESIPIFHKAAKYNLQKLILKNNYIENINGLQNLECLIELDLSYNCLMDHSVLRPLEMMPVLLWVCLEGNPLFYHPRHRLHTIKYLHPSLSDSKFVLDNIFLNKAEKLFVSENRVFLYKPIQSGSKEDLASLENSIISDISSVSVETLGNSEIRNQITEILPNLDAVVTKTKKLKNVKEAIIEDNDEEGQKLKDTNLLSKSCLELSMDHLETKRQILELRAKFGEENWLSSHSGTYIQNIMGLPSNFQATSSSPFANKNEHFVNESLNDSITNSNESDENLDQDYDNEEQITPEVSSANNSAILEQSINLSLSYDPEEETGDLYLVQRKKNQDLYDLFLILSPDEIVERDSITGKIKYRWASNTVLSCTMGRGSPITVDVSFDTTRKDRVSRTYIVQPEDAKKIVQTINEFIQSQPMTLKIFKCMKCSTHFSQDADNLILISSVATPPKCPTCKSTLVIQTDELSTPKDSLKDQKIPEYKETSNLQHSNSQSSIGSATSLEDSRESTPSAATITKKYESDIEVLSNPSQSSIEVLDDNVKSSPNKKPSLNEELLSQKNPASLALQELNPIMTGLTESSSSGSMTDSVCTTYENKTIKTLDKNEIPSIKITDEISVTKVVSDSERPYAPITNLTAMLGELLQSMKIGPSKDAASKLEDSSDFIDSEIQYSYTNFSDVDHRIKLHIILNIFEHENEELALLLRAEILTQTSTNTFPGCLVLSTAKVYILKIIGSEGENPQRWLHKESSWTIDRLRSFAPLPFKQGVLVELDQPNKLNEQVNNNVILCILQDFQRTSNFLFYLTDSPLPASCEVEFIVPQFCNTLIRDALKSSKIFSKNDPVIMLALFSSCIIKFSNQTINLNVSSLIITSSSLTILKDQMHWLLPKSNQIPTIAAEQGMSNLIEVDFCETSLNLNFLDEVAGIEVNWIINFVSSSAVEAVINSIRPPWEDLFSVPLQINITTNLSNNKT